MVSLASLWLPILVAAVAVFIASSIIHMATPWHHSDFTPMPEQGRVLDALRSFDIRPGDYVVPHPQNRKDASSSEFAELSKRGPMAFIGFALGLWQQTIWYSRSVVTTLKSTIDGLIYGAVTAGVFAWLWPK